MYENSTERSRTDQLQANSTNCQLYIRRAKHRIYIQHISKLHPSIHDKMPTTYSKPIVPAGNSISEPDIDNVQTCTVSFDHLSTEDVLIHFIQLLMETGVKGPTVITRELEGVLRTLRRRVCASKMDQKNLEALIVQIPQIWRDAVLLDTARTVTVHHDNDSDYDDQTTLTGDADMPDFSDNLHSSNDNAHEVTGNSEQPLAMILHPGVKHPRDEEKDRDIEGPPLSRRKLSIGDGTTHSVLEPLDSSHGDEHMHSDDDLSDTLGRRAEESPEAMVGAKEKGYLARMRLFRFGMNMGMNVNFWASFGW